MSRYFDLSQLKGNAAKRRMEYSPHPDIRIQDGLPDWVKKAIPDFGDKYLIWLSMSTVAVPFKNNIETFSSKTLVNSLVPGRYDNGEIFDPFCYDATRVVPKAPAKNSGRGRRPIQQKVETRRNYGTVSSFGTCLQCSCRVNMPFKDQLTRVYNIKVFENNIQCPGCITEDFRDVKLVLELIKEVLNKTFSCIPEPTMMFEEVRELLDDRGYGRLTHLEKATLVETGDVVIYSRNYNLHYRDLTSTEKTETPMLLNPQEVYTFLRNNRPTVEEWLQEAGLHDVIFEYESCSENTNRRIQAIFMAPKVIEDPKNKHITKCFIECSGKIAINLANNYFWEDIIWRMVVFLDKIFSVSRLYPKKGLAGNVVTDEQIDSFLEPIFAFVETF